MGRGFDPHPVHKRDESLGEMSEWSNEPVLKTGVLVRVPGVRIPLSPQKLAKRRLFLYMDVYIMFIFLIYTTLIKMNECQLVLIFLTL